MSVQPIKKNELNSGLDDLRQNLSQLVVQPRMSERLPIRKDRIYYSGKPSKDLQKLILQNQVDSSGDNNFMTQVVNEQNYKKMTERLQKADNKQIKVLENFMKFHRNSSTMNMNKKDDGNEFYDKLFMNDLRRAKRQ